MWAIEQRKAVKSHTLDTPQPKKTETHKSLCYLDLAYIKQTLLTVMDEEGVHGILLFTVEL